MVLRWTLLLAVAACNEPLQPQRLQPAPSSPVHESQIRTPERLTSIPTGRLDASAKEFRVGCATCHSLRALGRADPSGRSDGRVPVAPGELDQFHGGLVFEHGDNTCASCHVADRADVLRLATGEIIPCADAIRLCAQCHGPQWRDYQHGAHGGMNGYWDLSRGPRTRNHCIDCHDPHAPGYRGGAPVHRPLDRFLTRSAGDQP